jgi:hypothetical protein
MAEMARLWDPSKINFVPNRINPAIRAEVEASCGIKMPDGIIGYTKHGLERVLAEDPKRYPLAVRPEGVSTASVLDTWKNPVKIKFKPDDYSGVFKIYGKTSTVSVNPSGKITTAWSHDGGQKDISHQCDVCACIIFYVYMKRRGHTGYHGHEYIHEDELYNYLIDVARKDFGLSEVDEERTMLVTKKIMELCNKK